MAIVTQKQKLQWIEDNIQTDDFSLEEIREEIRRVAFDSYSLKRYGSYQNALSDMLQGLPSWNSFPFSNYNILELRNKWGYTTDEDKFLSNYWNALASLVIKYFKKQKLELF